MGLKITNLDICLSKVGFVLSLILFYISYNRTAGYGLSITLMISCLIYYLFISHDNIEDDIKTTFLNKYSLTSIVKLQLIISAWVVIFGVLSISSFYNMGHRPLWFFIIISVICAIISSEIFLLKNFLNKTIIKYNILFQIFILVVIITLSTILIYPEINAAGDHGIHRYFFENVLQNHQIPSDFYVFYGNFQIMNMLMSIGSIISNIYSYKISLLCFVYVPYILSLFFIYLVYNKISCTYLALFALSLTGINIWYLYWCAYLVPMSYSVLLFTFLIYLYSLPNESTRTKILLILISICITLTHPITSIAMVIFALLILLTTFINIYNKTKLQLNYLILVIITVVSYWIYNIFSVFAFQFTEFFSTPAFKSVSESMSVTLATNKPLIVYELDNLGIYVIYFLFLISALKYSSKFDRNDSKKFFIYLYISVFVLISYISFMLGIKAIIPHRWLFFASLLIGYPAADGLHIILLKFKNLYKIPIIFCVIFILSFSMIISTTINADSPVYGKYYSQQHSLKNSDIHLNNFMVNYIDKDYQVYGNPFMPINDPNIKVIKGFILTHYKFNDLIYIDVYTNNNLHIYKRI